MPIDPVERLEALKMLAVAQQLATEGKLLSLVLVTAVIVDGQVKVSAVQQLRSKVIPFMADALRTCAETLEDPHLMEQAAATYQAEGPSQPDLDVTSGEAKPGRLLN